MLQCEGLALRCGVSRQEMDSQTPQSRLESTMNVLVVIDDKYAR
jgi:hypothetical protein